MKNIVKMETILRRMEGYVLRESSLDGKFKKQ
jgi:hypothetical protein